MDVSGVNKGLTSSPAPGQTVSQTVKNTRQAEASAALEPQKVSFAVSPDNKEVVIEVLNNKGAVVKQIPPEEYLEMSKNLEKISGALFHVKA